MSTTEASHGIIYGVVHASEPTRVRYVGKTQRSLDIRRKEHWADSRNRARGAFGQWLRKHSGTPDDVHFSVLGEHTTLEELDEAEVQTIAQFKSRGQCDLNLAPGGAGTATGKTPGRPTPLRAENHPMRKLTWDQVNEIRRVRQERFIPAAELATKYGLLNEWAIRNVLWNKTWYDPNFDPDKVVEYTNDYHSGERGHMSRLTWAQVREMRNAAIQSFEPREKIGKRYGVTRGTVGFVLSNLTWIDPDYNPADLAPGPKRARVLDWVKVREVRDYYMNTGYPHIEVARRFGLGRSTTSLLLNNHTWVDEGYGQWLNDRLDP